MIGNFQGLFPVIRLGNIEVLNIYSKIFCVEAVESMFSIYECCNASGFLGFCNGMDSQCRFSRRFRAVDLNYPSPGISPDSEGNIKGDGPGGNKGYIFYGIVTHFHDGALAIALLNFIQR